MSRRVFLGVLGAVAVGAIGSGIWDVIARPGLNRAASALLTLFTLGSSTVRDLPYSSAALDPYCLPPLLLLYIGVILLPCLAIFPLLDTFVKPWLLLRRSQRESAVRSAAANNSEAEDAVSLLRTRRRRRLAMVIVAYGVLISGFAYVSFGVVNRAVAIRRIYDANMQILAPHISQDDFMRLRGGICGCEHKSGIRRTAT